MSAVAPLPSPQSKRTIWGKAPSASACAEHTSSCDGHESDGTPRARLLQSLREPVLDREPEVREVALLEGVLEVP